MRFKFTEHAPKIFGLCSTDQTRPTLTQPHFDAELGELQATDSYAAIRVPVEVEKGDSTGPIALAAFAEAVKSKASSLKALKKDRPKVGEFPNLPKLWPSKKEIDGSEFRLGIDARLLKNVADALGARNGYVELIFPRFERQKSPNAQRPIVVVREANAVGETRDGKGVAQAEAIIMPVALKNSPTPAATKATTPSKTSTTRSRPATSGRTADNGDFGKGSDRRREAALKAAETRRQKLAGNGNGASTKTTTKKATTKSVASALRTVAAAKNGKNGKGGKGGKAAAKKVVAAATSGDFGKGSDRRREAAIKAAETRRQKLAAASK